jgi:hypothetical protein
MKNDKIDIVKSASKLFIKITLKCLFGGENQDIKVLQRINGVESIQPLGETLIRLMEVNTVRNLQPHLILLEELTPYYIT